MFPLGTARNVSPQNVQGTSSLLKSTVCRKERVIATLFTIEYSAVLQTSYYKALSHWNQSQSITLIKKKKKSKRKTKQKNLLSNTCYWSVHTNMWISLYTSLAGTSGLLWQQRVRSSAAVHIGHFKGSISCCAVWGAMATRVPSVQWDFILKLQRWTNYLHQNGLHRILHLNFLPPPLHQGHPYRANPHNAEQETLGPCGSHPGCTAYS